MPSPIMHAAMGYVVYKAFEPDSTRSRFGKIGRIPILLVISLAASLLPDLDSVYGILAGDFGRYHNNATHSLIVGLLVALLFTGGVSVLFKKFEFWTIFLVILVSYQAHIIMDFFTISRGVMALWPLSLERFVSPISLFYGFHWSDGLFSIRHLWTFLSESIKAVILILTINYLTSRKLKKGIFGERSVIVSKRSEKT